MTYFIEPVELVADVESTFATFLTEKYPFWLDSSLTGPPRGRWSFMGANPHLSFRSWGDNVETEAGGVTTRTNGDPVALLRAIMRQRQLAPAPATPVSLPFVGGAVGYFSYDLGRVFERLPSVAADDLNCPDISLSFYDTVLALDHQCNKAYVVAQSLGDLKRLKDQLAGCKTLTDNPLEGASVDARELSAHFTLESYAQAVETIKDYIVAGDAYQVNMTQRISAPLRVESYQLYRRLRRVNPAPFAAYLDCGPSLKVLSSSPERFLTLRSRQVETRPVKGTRPRGKTPLEDAALARDLLASDKDRAELVMIIDLMRNDLGRVCEYGSVEVPELIVLEKYAQVMHLVSTVRGRLTQDKDVLDLLAATFPGGSITGAPKLRAMEIIEELEPVRRGIYTGSIGYIGYDGAVDLNIAIRTMIASGNQVYLQAGGAVVYDSEPKTEYEETLHKAKAMLQSLGVESIG